MLDFIKQLFAKKEIESIAKHEMAAWFDTKAGTRRTNFKEFVQSEAQPIQDQIEKIKELLTSLEKAELQNPDVPAKALNYMHGNRSAYIKQVQYFLSTINTEKLEHTREFVRDFKGNIKDLSKTTAKSFHIMQEFFGDISGQIADEIRKLNLIVEGIDREYKTKNIAALNRIRNDIDELFSKEEEKKELAETSSLKKQELEELEKRKQELEKKQTALQSSEAYNELQELNTQKEELEKRIQETQNLVTHSFSVIQAALKKFERITYENSRLIQKYGNDPIKALSQDPDLSILTILSKLKESILSESIELKESKQKRVLAEIETMNREFFTNFLDLSGKLNEKLEKVNQERNRHTIESEISDTKEELEEITKKIEQKKARIEELNKRHDEILPERMKEKLENDIEEALNTKITIT